jgi:Zn-dependent M28 family amino/carboxypeptidase
MQITSRVAMALAVSSLLCACSADLAKREGAVAAEAPVALDEQQYKAWLAEISSDRFEGRGPGSAGERRFVPWLVEEFQRIGLAPGNGDSYIQKVPMIELTGSMLEPLTFSITSASGTVLKTPLNPGDDFILSSHIVQPEITLKDSELVFLGYGVDQPAEQWNDYAGIDVRGKTVVMFANEPGFHVNDPTLFKGKAMTYAGRWTYKFEEAARQGAAGCLIIHDTAGASYGWDVLKNGWGRPEFELPPKAGQTAKLQVQGWISEETALALFTNEGLDLFKLREQASVRGFKGITLKSKASARIGNRIRQTESQNVAALIKGTERPEEVVVYTAHWDHLGRNFQLPDDGIYNGAIDNGTGVAALLEMGRAMVQKPPKRSVLMLAVTLEESGLLGSRYYAENPIFPLAKTVANLNMDALPLLGPSKEVVVVGFGSSELEDILKPLVLKQQRELVPEPTPENGFYFRSDHFNFAKVGVPALYVKSGPNHVEKGLAYGKAWMETYNRERYHKPSDAYDANADYRGLMQDLALLLQMGNTLANSDSFPNWYPNSEFRARRDQLMQSAP